MGLAPCCCPMLPGIRVRPAGRIMGRSSWAHANYAFHSRTTRCFCRNLYNPEENIATAARYIRFLSNHFNDIRNRAERINFVLAAYNGGFAHIRDAMALTRKYGGDPTSWKDVGPYVLRLSQPQYYRDPVVKNGYMIGSETYNYVNSVTERWRRYGGSVEAGAGFNDMHSTPVKATKHNRFTKKNHIMTPDELQNAVQ